MNPIQVAGALAERGTQELVLAQPAQPAQPARLLKARETDLPGVLADAPVGATLSTVDGLLVFVRRADGWHAESADT